MKLLITGANGLLGQKIVDLCIKKGIHFVATSKGDNRNSKCPMDKYRRLDITDETLVKTVLMEELPTHVIHTAAMTNVDECETNPEGCQKINVDATHYLVKACNALNCHFQLLSTDFIFDGEKGNYAEEDVPNPLSVYAQSKLDAETIVKTESTAPWSIVRTIIVYGDGENLSRSNLVLWALEAIPKNQEMKIVDDQFRPPTWADDLAWACVRICELEEKGVFHISGPETLSILEIVQRIASYLKESGENIVPISSSTLAQAAKRPPKTGFNLTKSREKLGYSPKKLEETLDLL